MLCVPKHQTEIMYRDEEGNLSVVLPENQMKVNDVLKTSQPQKHSDSINHTG